MWRRAAIVAVLIAVLCVDIHGFATQNLFAQHIWDTVGLLRLARFTGLFLAVAAPILLMVPWTFAGFVLCFAALASTIAVGPMAVIAVALFLVSSCTIGMRLVGESHLLATLTGVGLYVALMTLLANFPVNYPVVWAGILIAPILLDWPTVRRLTSDWGALLRSAELRSWSERCAAALLPFVMLMHWVVVLEPEKSADGLAMHLAIPANIAIRHAFTFQPAMYVWAVMPKGADFAYSIVYLLGGEFAARLLNLALLLMLAGLLYSPLRRSTSTAVSLFLVALFATTPLVQLVTGSLFVENAAAVMIFGAVSALWTFGETQHRGFLYATAVLAGTALAVKVGALSFLAVALPFLVWEIAKLRRTLAACTLALVLLLMTGLPAYGIAWWKTGNPIFPFKNDKIHSPLLDPTVTFEDNEFRKPLAWSNPYDLAFRTHGFYEGQNGTLGFQYTLLLPLGLLAVFVAPSRRTVASVAIAVGASILILRSEPNARYLYPAMPLLFVPFGALLGSLAASRWLRAILLSLAGLCVALNLYFLPGSGWYHKDFHPRSPFSKAGRERYMREYIPIRTALQEFNRAHPGANIFLANDEDVADPQGDSYQGGWHQFNMLVELRKARTLPEMAKLFEKWNVQYVASRQNGPEEPRDPAILDTFVEKCTVVEFRVERIRLSRIDAAACR